MRPLFLIALLVSSAASGANWATIGTSGNARFDIDMDSIERADSGVKAWFQENTLSRRQNPVGKYYRSVVTLEVFQCQAKTTALEKAIYYSSPNKSGKVVGDFSISVEAADFVRVVPGSIGEIKMEKACEIGGAAPGQKAL